ncbi:MAG: endonuclease domain-containing protein [Candidatus Doudnabacteria bacterium]|nr:endonuclease domain-containing protein [Candidatus Doudnabacteria bacterium]
MDYQIIKNRPDTVNFRKQLRNNSSPAEIILWLELKGRKLNGRKFRRQYGVEQFTVDFYCPECKLAVELDGETHNNPQSFNYDAKRTEVILGHGIKTIRFTNKEIRENLAGVLEEIKKYLD